MSDSPDAPMQRPEDDPEIAALLNFEPVPRKIKVPGGWDAGNQRELIARIAVHGSPNRACSEMGKHRTGLTNLFNSPGARSFRESHDGAIALAARRRAEKAAADFVPPGTMPSLDGRRTSRAQSVRGTDEHEAPLLRDPLPVICDQCAAQGVAGDEAFASIPDLLTFEPVPRPVHDRLWDAPTQRAFIAALAVTGSAARAARSVGRHAYGAEKLKKARGARGFNEAWDAALDIARTRELAKMGGSLSELGAENGARIEEDEEAGRAEYEGARDRINMRLTNCRRLYLSEIADDEAKRAAWELLCGPTDWSAPPA